MLQGPELLRQAEAADALAKVPFIAVMATHEGPELERAHAVLPAAVWAEVEGTFTNYARRVQRVRRAVPPPGEADPACGRSPRACSIDWASPSAPPRPARCSPGSASTVKGYAGLDYKTIGALGQALDAAGEPTGLARRRLGPDRPAGAEQAKPWPPASSPSTAPPTWASPPSWRGWPSP